MVARERLIDETIDAYVAWREECTGLRTVYRAWCRTAHTPGTTSFEQYTAALDREERAANRYADALGQLTRLLWHQ